MIKMDCEPINLKYVLLVSLTDISKLLLALVLLVEAIKPAFRTIRTIIESKYMYIHKYIYTLYKPCGLQTY